MSDSIEGFLRAIEPSVAVSVSISPTSCGSVRESILKAQQFVIWNKKFISKRNL